MPRGALGWALLIGLVLPGCAAPGGEPEAAAAPVAPRVMDWSPGNWWAYHATIGNVTLDVALIVHERSADGFRLGTNLSVGFFGLPFNGNVTHQLNPRIGADVWPLFQFPLADGKEWDYELFGYQATALAAADTVDVASLGPRAGYSIEARSFGQLFARYTYAPDAGWFTRLEIIEPTDGSRVLAAELTAFGTDWNAAYYVEETVRSVEVEYPALPGQIELDVPGGYLQARATLTAKLATGALSATLRDEDGRALASAASYLRGTDIDRASARIAGPVTWRLDHRGAGLGSVHLEITGVSATGPLAAPSGDEAPEVDLPALLQSTLPARPHEGHTIATAAPLALGA